MPRAFELGSVAHAAYDVPKKYDAEAGDKFFLRTVGAHVLERGEGVV